jgi:endo-1,4-beta-xylanase
MFNLVQDLKQRGIPIDGIGIQSHLIVGAVPSDLQANFEHFASLGVEIAITELDIRMTLPATEELLEQQRQDYQTVVAACNAVEACVGVTIWDCECYMLLLRYLLALNEVLLSLDTDKVSLKWTIKPLPNRF